MNVNHNYLARSLSEAGGSGFGRRVMSTLDSCDKMTQGRTSTPTRYTVTSVVIVCRLP